MASKSESLNHRISASYKQLTTAASELNTGSDELGKFVTALDSAPAALIWALRRGCASSREDGSGNYIKRDLGYAKVSGRGIALRTMTGNHNVVEDGIEESGSSTMCAARFVSKRSRSCGSLRQPRQGRTSRPGKSAARRSMSSNWPTHWASRQQRRLRPRPRPARNRTTQALSLHGPSDDLTTTKKAPPRS